MKTQTTPLSQLIAALTWLDGFFQRIRAQSPVINEHWLNAGTNLEEVRRRGGNGPDVQAATAEWLRAGLEASMKRLHDTRETHPEIAIEPFIGENFRARWTPLDLGIYERHLAHANNVGPALDELRLTYWRFLVALAKRTNASETAQLHARLREQIACAHWRGTRDCEDQQGYRRTCRELDLDPGPKWTQTPRELLRV